MTIYHHPLASPKTLKTSFTYMGHRHSRPKTPPRDVYIAPVDWRNARSAHVSHSRREASPKSSRWRSVRKPNLPSEGQPDARCKDVDQLASPSEPGSKPEPVPPTINHPPCGIDSLGPLETNDESARSSGPSEQVKGPPTTPRSQIHDPSSAPPPITVDILNPFQAAITSSQQIEESDKLIRRPRGPTDAGTGLQAASSLTDHNPGPSTGRQYALLAPHRPTLREAAKEPHGEHLVAWQDLTESGSVEGEETVAQAALDYAMAVSLRAEDDPGRAAELETPSKDCAVCCDSLHPLEFPAKPPSSECTHAADVCFPCLQQWVATKVDANARAVIDCPRCTTLLSHEDVRRACNFETFAKYDRFTALSVVNDLQNFHWCLRPGCSAGQEHIGGHLGYMQCYACDFEQCLKHKTEWHRGQTCRQYDALTRTQADKLLREQEERGTTKFMDEQQIKVRLRECQRCRNKIPEGEEIPKWCPKRGCRVSLERGPLWKKCPACHTLIEKIYGCDQMKCTVSTATSSISCNMLQIS